MLMILERTKSALVTDAHHSPKMVRFFFDDKERGNSALPLTVAIQMPLTRPNRNDGRENENDETKKNPRHLFLFLLFPKSLNESSSCAQQQQN